MHALHCILLKISPEQPIDEIRYMAEEETECYYGRCFDWRETDTAGRWDALYPKNVILAKDDLDKFIKILEEAQNNIKTEIDYYLKRVIENDADLKLSELPDKLSMKNNSIDVETKRYNLRKLAQLLDYQYCFESQFYNVEEYSSYISERTFNDIKNNPENWAIVMFDYHF